jgi:hypothetical protein
MKISNVFPAACAMLLAVSMQAFAADATSSIQGNVVVAKAGEHPLLIWDASAVVAALTSAKTPRDRALAELESDAVNLTDARLSDLASAHDITVRVIYMKMGAVNPQYGAPTLEGVEKLLTLKASRGDLASQGSAWATQLSAQKAPQGLAVSVTGQLPPV